MHLRSVSLCFLCAMLGGCGFSAPPKVQTVSRPVPDERPKDLAIAATVFAPRVPLPEANLPRSLRPARYIIEADGVLRAAQGPVTTTFPPRVRQLTPREADQIWRLLRDSGFLVPGNANQMSDPEAAVRSGDRTTAMVFVSYGGQRTTLRILLDRSNADALDAERLVDRLATLSWSPE